jgi:hypothetical protein
VPRSVPCSRPLRAHPTTALTPAVSAAGQPPSQRNVVIFDEPDRPPSTCLSAVRMRVLPSESAGRASRYQWRADLLVCVAANGTNPEATDHDRRGLSVSAQGLARRSLKSA